MALRIISLEDKVTAIGQAIDIARRAPRAPGSPEQAHYEAMKAISADLRGRLPLPRNNTLGELGRLLQKMKDAPRNGQFYDTGMMVAVANFVISRWPTISQSLEVFGEESCE